VETSYAFDITVMTPTFNRAHTLPRLYASLQDQTVRNFEWVVVDDGSTDNTPALFEKWCLDSPFPIHCLRQSNLGKHVSKNRGVDMSRGRFFVGVDSDDWLLPNALQRLLEVWETIPADRRDGFLGVAGRCASPDGTKLGRDLPTHFLDSEEIEYRGRFRIAGDNAGMSRIEVLRAFPMPEVEGESHTTDAVVANRIAQQYKTRYFDEVIEIREYQKGGLTDRSRLNWMQNPLSALVFYEELLAARDRLAWRARFRASANFARYSMHAGRPLWRTRGENDVGTWLVSLPAAVFLWAGDRLEWRRNAPVVRRIS
jgi:glycosyltransferase involved in cell wall biosynthesis